MVHRFVGSCHQNVAFANFAQAENALVKNRLSLPERSVSNTDKDLDRVPHDPPHSHRAHANSHSPSPPKTHQRPRSPASLPSQEHKSSSSAPSQNSSDEWEKLLITDHTQDTTYLLLLLHAMGGSQIPELLLDRVLMPQRRWNSSGMEITVTALEASLDQHLLDILSYTDRRIQVINTFVKSNTSNGSWALSLESHFQSRISQLLSD